jgi:hypothetical protein
MPTVNELEKAFAVYFDEIDRCRQAGAYWALLHVVVALPDICGALESDNGWATGEKHIEWCARYWRPGDGCLSPDDYRDIRNIVLHQGRSVTKQGRFYKFTRPTALGVFHRNSSCTSSGDVVVLDVGELAAELVDGIRAWFRDLQTDGARRANVAKNLPKLVIVETREVPGIGGPRFDLINTITPQRPAGSGPVQPPGV